MKQPNWYSDPSLDRLALKRTDQAWILSRIRKLECRILLMQESKHAVDDTGEPLVLNADAFSDPERIDWILLGSAGQEQVWLTLDLCNLERDDWPKLPGTTAWRELRTISGGIDPQMASILAFARGLNYWHRNNRHCRRCGAANLPTQAGHQRCCTNPECHHRSFPRVDPAVIMLIHQGDHCLLGRQPHWPEGRHSVLAGYVEPGESLEQTVMREVHEEVGIDVDDIRYHSSQAWPFPASVMVGFTARALNDSIILHDAELESAAWYSRDYLLAEPPGFSLPSRDSIAYRLVNDWLEGELG